MPYIAVHGRQTDLPQPRKTEMSNIVRRTFLPINSSAIAYVDIENAPQVQIAFQSNPQKVYTFQGSESVVDELQSILNAEEVQGLGSLVAAARRSGDLQEV